MEFLALTFNTGLCARINSFIEVVQIHNSDIIPALGPTEYGYETILQSPAG